MKPFFAPNKLLTTAAGLASFLLLTIHTTAAAQTGTARNPLVVAPVIEGLQMCDEAAQDPRFTDVYEAEAQCRRQKISGAAALNRLLDTLEPGGPKGQVQIGFTATLQLLGLYKQSGKGWEIDDEQLDNFLRVIKEVKRPVVLYLAADHFDSFGPLTRELQKNPRNLLQLRDGKPLNLNYFGYHVIPYTLQTDPSIPVNRYRYAALKHVAKKISALPKEAQSRIVGITFMGELHQMFPDFENGMGSFKDVQVTDYSPASVSGFQTWLEKQFSTIGQLNSATGLTFKSWTDVAAPAKDIRKEKLAHFGEHYDAFADGKLPFSGWLWDPQNQIQKLDLYVDGRFAAPIERGFNRLDVYRAVENITDPNVGFRVDYDFSQVSPGPHVAQAVVESNGKKYLLGEASFTVVPPNQSSVAQQHAASLRSLPKLDKLRGVRGWMDLPSSGQDVYFNPLAKLWNQYREWQVVHMLEEFHTRAMQAGLPAAKLYSHQIMPRVNSSWNHNLFAANSSLKAQLPWKQGINMYGGSTHSTWMRDYIARERITDYGVPEFHPQQWKTESVHMTALQAQYDQGARFISPYYFSLVPQRFKGNGFGINRLELGPNNQQDGSHQFYKALIEFAKR